MRVDENSQMKAVIHVVPNNALVRFHPKSRLAERREIARKIKT